MTLDEWATHHGMSRSKALAALAETYGKPGKDGWSLTEVLRLDGRKRTRMLDLLNGIAKQPGAPTYEGAFRIRTVTGQPLTLAKVRPDPDQEPAIRSWDPATNEPGISHHAPSQWVPIDYTVAPEAEYPLVNHAHPGNPYKSAATLLLRCGYGAREGGSPKRRWGDKKKKELDRWEVYEVAFAERFPKLCPVHRPEQSRRAAA